MTQLTEYLSKSLLAGFGVPFADSRLVSSRDDAYDAARVVGSPVMVKAQVPVGGRGKAGAVVRAETPSAAREAFLRVTTIPVGSLLAMDALIEPVVSCAAEYFLAAMIDFENATPIVLFSPSGGTEIEFAEAPLRLAILPDGSVPAELFRQGASRTLPALVVEALLTIAEKLARALEDLDATVVELNPVGLTTDGNLVALDARVVLDDNALFRHPDLLALVRQMRPRYPEDIIRDQTRIEYVALEGSLGLISGGAGMTMAAIDLIADYGGNSACFLDCSANPTANGYGAALELLLGQPQVEGILISIFGGLTQVDRVARTLVRVLSEHDATKPITIRLMGTNVEGANQRLAAAGWTNHISLESAVQAALASRAVSLDSALART